MKSIPHNEPCPDCGRFANRGMTIDALIVRDNKILLIKRGAEPFKGYWGTPGGYADWDEDLTKTVEREVREELGVDAHVKKLLGIYSKPARHPKQAMAAAFVIEVDGEAVAGDDAVECQWFNLDKLPERLAFDHAKIIEDFRNGKSGAY